MLYVQPIGLDAEDNKITEIVMYRTGMTTGKFGRICMDMTKKILIIGILLFVYVCGAFSTGNNYLLRAAVFDSDNEDIVIESETVCFHEDKIESDIIVKNIGRTEINGEIRIACIPVYNDALCVGALVPDGFCIKEDGKKRNLYVLYQGKVFTEKDFYETRLSSEAIICSEFSIKPNEIKNYRIECVDLFGDVFGVKKMSKYSFNRKSEKKLVKYISTDNSLDKEYKYILNDFVYGDEEKIQSVETGIDGYALHELYSYNKSISKNIKRVYSNDDFSWSLELPEDCTEVGCVQSEYHFDGDRSSFLLYRPYPYDSYSYDKSMGSLRFDNKPLDSTMVPENLLFFLSKQELSILRNAFYAAHGYNFRNPYLKIFFFTWRRLPC